MPRRPSHEVLASNVHRLVFERDMTLQQVAEAAGLTLEELEGIFSGEVDPGLDLVARIADVFELTVPEILTEPDYH